MASYISEAYESCYNILNYINLSQTNKSYYYDKYYVLNESLANVNILSDINNDLSGIDSKKIAYGNIAFSNLLIALQMHVINNYESGLNSFLYNNGIKVKRGFATFSSSLGFSIDENNIEG